MGSPLALDDLVADVLDQLEASGELDNTVLIFTSDHGYNLGAHHLLGKMAPYEESIRVPLVVAGPDIRSGTDTRTVLLLDLLPSILETAGAPIPDDVDGMSFRPLLTGTGPGRWRSSFLVQYRPGVPDDDPARRLQLGFSSDMPTYRALRTPDHLFVEWYAPDEVGGYHDYELYDLRVDPYQLQNQLATRADLDARRGQVLALLRRLDQLSSCAGLTCRG